MRASHKWSSLSPLLSAVPEATTPALAPCPARPGPPWQFLSLSHTPAAPLPAPVLLDAPSPAPGSRVLPAPPTPPLPCASPFSPPPPPKGHLPLTSRLHWPWGPLSPFLDWGVTDGKKCGRLHRAGPKELIRGTGAPTPSSCSSSPASPLLKSRQEASILAKGPRPLAPHADLETPALWAQPGRVRGSCANLPHGFTLCQPCHGSWAGKALGAETALPRPPRTA